MSTRQRLLLGAFALALGGPAWAVKCPNIMLVLDQSGSMSETPAGTFPKQGEKSKWQILQDAIVAVINKYGDQVPFGLELYTGFGADNQECYKLTKIDVEPAHDTAAAIIAKVKAAKPDSGTNTGEAVKRAASSKAMADPSRGQFIVLVTDGDPNCNTGDEGGDAVYTVSEINAAAKRSPPIKTYVIGFDGMSGGVNPDNLNKMAKAGGVPIMGCTGAANSRCYYSASNAQKFIDAINKVINEVVGGGEFGMAMCDDSCYANGCPEGYVCQTDEFNRKPACVPDPCHGVKEQCPPTAFCRQGQCIEACPRQCRPTERCVDGQCLANPCAMVTCGDGELCDANTGGCVPNLCLNVKCKGLTVCDPLTGHCGDDQCRIITCPEGAVCKAGGNCESTSASPDGGVGGLRPKTRGGCSTADRSGEDRATRAGLLSALGLFASLALLTRRRGRR